MDRITAASQRRTGRPELRILLIAVASWGAVVQSFAPSAPPRRPQLWTTRQMVSNNNNNFYNDFEGFEEDDGHEEEDEDDDDDDDDDYLSSTLDQMDWRSFRRQLAVQQEEEDDDDDSESRPKKKKPKGRVCPENQDVVKSQNKKIFQEYADQAWAHETAMPEVGGLIVRLPLEIELQRNYKHSLTGHRLKETYGSADHDNETDDDDDVDPNTTVSPLSRSRRSSSSDDDDDDDDTPTTLELWYRRAQTMVERDLQSLSEAAAVDGQIDATSLDDDMAEMLQLYLDHQETWQEVCLVLEKKDQQQQQQTESSSALVLNRPMALKLTENLGQLVLLGAYRMDTDKKKIDKRRPSLEKFMKAFGPECAVYIGGPDDQDRPAELIHGIADLPGSTEIAPGTGIYRGGMAAAVDGVLSGAFQPLEFRFFVGRHKFPRATVPVELLAEEEEEDDTRTRGSDKEDDDDESAAAFLTSLTLDLSVVLGKYQPIACARCLVLKQCISLPKPLWHEVMELSGGDMYEISQLELNKEGDTNFIQIVDDDEDDDDSDSEIEIVDELSELFEFDDDEDDDDQYYGGR